MKLYAPGYYQKFKCIADRCRHSCCVGWEIGVDDATLSRWEGASLRGADLLSAVGEEHTISLTPDGRCPFLNSSGLCDIICAYGESATPVICREHPRFYVRSGDRVELGIGAVCEEACRLILTESALPFVCIGEREWDDDGGEYDAAGHRERILYSILSADSSYVRVIDELLRDYSIPRDAINPTALSECISELELLREEDRGALLSAGRAEWAECYLRRFLVYLVCRHLPESDSEENLRARLAFCILLTSMLEGAASKTLDFSDLLLAARTISEEIEYSEDNTDALIFELECRI